MFIKQTLNIKSIILSAVVMALLFSLLGPLSAHAQAAQANSNATADNTSTSATDEEEDEESENEEEEESDEDEEEEEETKDRGPSDKINSLLKQIDNLRAKLNNLRSGNQSSGDEDDSSDERTRGNGPNFENGLPALPEQASDRAKEVRQCIQLGRSLRLGSQGDEVLNVQKFLKEKGFFNFSTTTGYFGPITQEAVEDFQESEGIVTSGSPESTGFGLIGPRTRAALAQASCLSEGQSDDDEDEEETEELDEEENNEEADEEESDETEEGEESDEEESEENDDEESDEESNDEDNSDESDEETTNEDDEETEETA